MSTELSSAAPVPATDVLQLLADVGTTHVVAVPDTNLRTVLAGLRLPVARATTEDDVFGIAAGLWMTGARPVALVQQLGLFAAVNTLRAFVHDQGVPVRMVAGLYGRDVTASPTAASQPSAVRLCLPLLDALQIPYCVVESPDDLATAREVLTAADTPGGSGAVLFGAPTS